MLKQVDSSLKKLENWFDKNGTKGYDPYDVKGYNSYTLQLWEDFKLLNWHQIISRLFLLDFADSYFPIITRKFLFVKKKEHPTVHGLLLSSHCLLYEVNRDEKDLEKAKKHADWLIQNQIQDKKYISWGTPFNWKSGEKIFGSNTSLSVVNAWCGEGFHRLYSITKEDKYLDVLQSIGNNIVEEIGYIRLNENEICFSYSSDKKDYILNANLFAAEFILRTAKLIDNSHWIELANQATSYVLRNIKKEGYLNYFGDEQNQPTENDVYHSGYEIRMLYRIAELSSRDDVKKAAEKYLSYFVDSYFDSNGIKFKKSHKLPIDITGCAEAITTLSLHANEQGKKELHQLMNFMTNKFQSKNGAFYYRVLKTGYLIKAPYVRWGQAWMFYALSTYIHEQR